MFWKARELAPASVLILRMLMPATAKKKLMVAATVEDMVEAATAAEVAMAVVVDTAVEAATEVATEVELTEVAAMGVVMAAEAAMQPVERQDPLAVHEGKPAETPVRVPPKNRPAKANSLVVRSRRMFYQTDSNVDMMS